MTTTNSKKHLALAARLCLTIQTLDLQTLKQVCLRSMAAEHEQKIIRIRSLKNLVKIAINYTKDYPFVFSKAMRDVRKQSGGCAFDDPFEYDREVKIAENSWIRVLHSDYPKTDVNGDEFMHLRKRATIMNAMCKSLSANNPNFVENMIQRFRFSTTLALFHEGEITSIMICDVSRYNVLELGLLCSNRKARILMTALLYLSDLNQKHLFGGTYNRITLESTTSAKGFYEKCGFEAGEYDEEKQVTFMNAHTRRKPVQSHPLNAQINTD